MAEQLLIPREPVLLNQMAQQISNEMAQLHLSVATAEGCLGGMLANTFTFPGATRIYHVGSIPYSLEAKIDLGVSPTTIARYGEYSVEVAMEMATRVRTIRNDWLGVGVTGKLDGANSVAHIALSTRDGHVKTKTIDLPPAPRYVQKQLVTLVTLSEIYQILPNHTSFQRKWNFDEISWVSTQTLGSSVMEKLYTDPLVPKIIQLLSGLGIKITGMESCTGGFLMDVLTSIPGASNVVDGGYVAYDENVKIGLGVPPIILVNGMVYSLLTGMWMAKSALKHSPAFISVGITGTMENYDTRPFHEDFEPGTVFVVIMTRDGRKEELALRVPVASREEMKVFVAREVLGALYKMLLEMQSVRGDLLNPADVFAPRFD